MPTYPFSGFRKHRKIAILAVIFAATLPIFAENRVSASFKVDSTESASSQRVSIHLSIPDGWHIYGKNPGDVGRPTTVRWAPNSAIKVIEKKWPTASPFTLGPITSYGYSGTLTLPYLIQSTQSSTTTSATIEWIVCKEECIPESIVLSIPLKFKTLATIHSPAPAAPVSTSIPNTDYTLIIAIIGGFLGGLLLNLMPCVFPVISLKIVSFSKLAAGNTTEIKRNGLIFSSGIMVSIWMLSGLLLGLRHWSSAFGWGFQLQSPAFITALILVFIAIATNLFGLYEIGVSLTTASTKGISGRLKTFMNGVLVTVVATPCTAPFMGAALGVALTQPTWISLAIFTALGLGLSLPYLALSFMPTLIQRLPKPGPWMETLKHALGFPMLGTAIWLHWVLSNQIGNNGALTASLGALALSIVLWRYGKQVLSPIRGWVWLITGIAISVGTVTMVHHASQPKVSPWASFSVEAVNAARASGDVVFIDYTADWCLTCQYNEKSVLNTQSIQTLFKRNQVRLFKADWTTKDPIITAELAKLGRSGVPVYVVYHPGKDALVLSSILTKNDIRSAILGLPLPPVVSH